MIIGLGIDFLVCLSWLDIKFFGFCFLSAFYESVMAVCCLIYCLSVLMLGIPAGVGGWDAATSMCLGGGG